LSILPISIWATRWLPIPRLLLWWIECWVIWWWLCIGYDGFIACSCECEIYLFLCEVLGLEKCDSLVEGRLRNRGVLEEGDSR